MRFLILGLLLDGPLSLYEIRRQFTAGISLFYAASLGGIQHALKALQADGLVAVAEPRASGRRTRPIAVTEAGRAAWRDWMTSPIEGTDPEPTMLARVYLLGSLPQGERPACLRVIRARIVDDAAALAALADEMANIEIPPGSRDVARYRRATLDYGIRSHALALEWLDGLGA